MESKEIDNKIGWTGFKIWNTKKQLGEVLKDLVIVMRYLEDMTEVQRARLWATLRDFKKTIDGTRIILDNFREVLEVEKC